MIDFFHNSDCDEIIGIPTTRGAPQRSFTKTHTLLGTRPRLLLLLANPQTPFSSSHQIESCCWNDSPKRPEYPAFQRQLATYSHSIRFRGGLRQMLPSFAWHWAFFDGRPRLLNDEQTILSSLLLFNMAFPFSGRNNEPRTHCHRHRNPSHKHTRTSR